jgi:hypothetical protein
LIFAYISSLSLLKLSALPTSDAAGPQVSPPVKSRGDQHTAGPIGHEGDVSPSMAVLCLMMGWDFDHDSCNRIACGEIATVR